MVNNMFFCHNIFYYFLSEIIKKLHCGVGAEEVSRPPDIHHYRSALSKMAHTLQPNETILRFRQRHRLMSITLVVAYHSFGLKQKSAE